MTCTRCGVASIGFDGTSSGTLHVLLPTDHARQKLAAMLRERGTDPEAAHALVSIPVAGDLGSVVDAVLGALTSAERAETRAFFATGAEAGLLAAAMGAEPIDAFRAKLRSGWLAEMIRDKRLVSMLQPILDLKTRGLFAYECLVRGVVETKLVSPDRLFEVARASGMLPQLDVAARRAAVSAASRREGDHRIFVNFTPSTVYDPRFCLRTTLEAIREVGIPPQRVVFEVVESERIDDVGHVRSVLDAYRAEGFAVALDDLGSGYASLGLLHELRPDFVKIDMGLVRNVDVDPWKATFMAKLLEAAQNVGVRTIAEGIETPGELAWVEAHGADFGQGYFLGRPALPADPSFVPESAVVLARRAG